MSILSISDAFLHCVISLITSGTLALSTTLHASW